MQTSFLLDLCFGVLCLTSLSWHCFLKIPVEITIISWTSYFCVVQIRDLFFFPYVDIQLNKGGLNRPPFCIDGQLLPVISQGSICPGSFSYSASLVCSSNPEPKLHCTAYYSILSPNIYKSPKVVFLLKCLNYFWLFDFHIY